MSPASHGSQRNWIGTLVAFEGMETYKTGWLRYLAIFAYSSVPLNGCTVDRGRENHRGAGIGIQAFTSLLMYNTTQHTSVAIYNGKLIASYENVLSLVGE